MGEIRFKPEHRRIFEWNDGTQDRADDPLVIARKLHQAAPDLGSHLKTLKVYEDAREIQEKLPACDNDSNVFGMLKGRALEATADIASAVRQAFDLRPAGPGPVGITEADCIRLYSAYRAFMRELEEESRPLPSSPLATEQAASTTLTTEHSSASTPVAAE